MVVRGTSKTKTGAKKMASKARKQGYDASVYKRKNKRKYAVSVTRK